MAKLIKVSPETAQRVLALLEAHDDSPWAAAHDVRVGLQAIEPYTDRRSERVLFVLGALQRADRRDQGEAWREKLREIEAS